MDLKETIEKRIKDISEELKRSMETTQFYQLRTIKLQAGLDELLLLLKSEKEEVKE